MKCLRRWLKHGGYFLVEIPNVEAVCQQPHTQFHRGAPASFQSSDVADDGAESGLYGVEP